MQLNLTAGEEVEIEYEVDGWFSVSTLTATYRYLLNFFQPTQDLSTHQPAVDKLWYGIMQVRKKRPGRDGKLTGLVPVLYVTT